MSFEVTISNLIKARLPIVYINTWEENRAVQIITSTCHNSTLVKRIRKVITWSATEGLIDENDNIIEYTNDPLEALEHFQNNQDACVYIFKDLHVYLAQGKLYDFNVIRKLRDLVPSIQNGAYLKTIIITSPTTALPDELQKDVTVIDFNLPTQEEIMATLCGIIDANQSANIKIELNEDEKKALCNAALGLTLKEAENAFAKSIVDNGVLDISDLDLILKEKAQIIKKTGILEYVNSPLNLSDVGGLDNLKRWLLRRTNSWSDKAKEYNLMPPKGVLVTGIPGCGKSLVAKSISTIFKMPLLKLDMGNIYSSYLGSSEENMRRAIKTAEAIAPSILWIDEIEKGLSASTGTDGGTSSRILGTFLTWMQEKTSPVFVIATANNIKALPPELLRKGRFDEIFFVDLPTLSERTAIWKVHISKKLGATKMDISGLLEDSTLEELSLATEGFVGSEIEQVVINATFDAFNEDRSVQKSDFFTAIERTVPLSITMSEEILSIRNWANVRAVSASAVEDLTTYSTEDKQPTPQDFNADVKTKRGGRTVEY